MKNDIRKWIYLTTALIALLLSACFDTGNKKPTRTMLQDKEAIQAPYALIRLKERPVFPVDDRKRSFAMIDDRNDKIKAKDRPLNIQESRSE